METSSEFTDAVVQDAEIQEWLESLDYVLQAGGTDRAKIILEQLQTQARQSDVDLPYHSNEPYINTIPVASYILDEYDSITDNGQATKIINYGYMPQYSHPLPYSKEEKEFALSPKEETFEEEDKVPNLNLKSLSLISKRLPLSPENVKNNTKKKKPKQSSPHNRHKIDRKAVDRHCAKLARAPRADSGKISGY